MSPFPDWIWSVAGLLIGGISAYFGAMNAVRENIARLQEQVKSARERADDAHEHAMQARNRVDALFERLLK